jgi:hypothetical protein
MSNSSSESDRSAHREFPPEQPPREVVYGPPQHDTNVPVDPDRAMFCVDEGDAVPSERERYAMFPHYRPSEWPGSVRISTVRPQTV